MRAFPFTMKGYTLFIGISRLIYREHYTLPQLIPRNGKIHSTPLFKVRKLVLFNRERYIKVKGIAGSVARRVLKRKSSKNLGAKIKKIEPLTLRSDYGNYEPSKITLYAQNGSIWRWRRVNEWFEDMKDYDKIAR